MGWLQDSVCSERELGDSLPTEEMGRCVKLSLEIVHIHRSYILCRKTELGSLPQHVCDVNESEKLCLLQQQSANSEEGLENKVEFDEI